MEFELESAIPRNLSGEARVIESLMSIQSKSGISVPFKLNTAQRFLDQNETNRTIITKPRQRGFSSIVLAKFLVRCLSREGTHAVVISHEAEATERLFGRVKFYVEHLKGPKPVISRNSARELYFKKTESTYYIGTAGAKSFGRGDWITDLHCSEYAWWEGEGKKYVAGLFQAVPDSGRIYIESTGNGEDNDFHYIFTNSDRLGYKPLFYPWFVDPECRRDLPYAGNWYPEDIPRHEGYLWGLKEKYKLTDPQIYWYECKLKEFREDLPLCQQEYPSCPEDCFRTTGGKYFDLVPFKENAQWVTSSVASQRVNLLTPHPVKSGTSLHYVLGADPAGGTGNDEAVCHVYCVETYEQVLEFYSDRIDPVDFGLFLRDVASFFNNAFIVCESNNHGIATLSVLKRTYPRDKIFHSSPVRYGFINSSTTKPGLVALGKELIDEGLVFYGDLTNKAFHAFKETDNNKLEGTDDHHVIAACLACVGLRKLQKYRWAYLEPIPEPKPKEKPNYMTFTLDEILDNIGKRRTEGIFGRQVAD